MAMPAQGNMAMLARLLMSQKQGQPPQMQQPFVGLGGLPPFEQPGSSLPAEGYISSPQPRPGPSEAPPMAAPPPQTQPAIGQGGDAGVLQPPPVDATVAPPMPPPVPVRDSVMQSLEQMAKEGRLPPQFAEMFPQYAGGSMTQMAGGR